MTSVIARLWLGAVLLLPALWAHAADEFPGREIYTDVPVLSLEELRERLNDVVVVDVRSQYEYETLRIKGAQNIPVAGHGFGEGVEALRATTDKPIVFYCNGRTCYKSYQAVRKAGVAKVGNCYAYDAGIFDWAKAYPDQAVLLGKTPISPDRLIDKERFQSHLLEPEAFAEKVHAGAVVLDVRDRFQRAATGLFTLKEHRVGLDETDKLDKYIEKAKAQGKPLLIYDEVGKQVRWFQYYLEERDVPEYYFMKGGAKAFFEVLERRQGGAG